MAGGIPDEVAVPKVSFYEENPVSQKFLNDVYLKA